MFRSLLRECKPITGRRPSLANSMAAYNTGAGGGRLVGKVALVTGGASGLGKATAHEFVKDGARVVVADVNSHLGPEVVESLGPSAHFVCCDVTEEAQVANAVDTTMARHGRLDIMFNSAGIPGLSVPPGIVELDLEQFDQVMRVNLRGTVAGMKHAARVMVPAGCGSILCMSSISGILGGLGPHPYTVSKFAIPGLVKSVASELCRNGVRINCISPAPIPTPMAVGQIAQFFPQATHEQVVGIVYGLGELKGARCEEIDVARAAVYLASDEAKYVTGHNLVVDGGFTCFKNLSFPSPDDHQ